MPKYLSTQNITYQPKFCLIKVEQISIVEQNQRKKPLDNIVQKNNYQPVNFFYIYQAFSFQFPSSKSQETKVGFIFNFKTKIQFKITIQSIQTINQKISLQFQSLVQKEVLCSFFWNLL